MLSLMKVKSDKGNLKLMDIPIPIPEKDQVVIKVAYAGICASDLHIQDADIELTVKPPVVMGHEFSGTIDSIGPSVTGMNIGDKVSAETTFESCDTCSLCKSNRRNLCKDKKLIGYVFNGAFASHIIVNQNQVVKLPLHLTDMRHAAILEPFACCIHAVTNLPLSADRYKNVVIAGPGVIGLLTAQLFDKVFIYGTNDQSSIERLEVARKLKIHHVTMEDRIEKTVMEQTNGVGADLFIECSGSLRAVNMGLNLLKRRGTFLQIGLANRDDCTVVDFSKIAYKELGVLGSIGSVRQDWDRALVGVGRRVINVDPLVGNIYPLTHWQQAFYDARNGIGVKTMFCFDDKS